MSDILFIRTSSLGDVIRHMPAVAEARRRVAGARIAWAVDKALVPIVALNRAIDAVVPVAARRWRGSIMHAVTRRELGEFVRDLRHPFDIVIDAQGQFGSACMARLARGRRHGYSMRSADTAAAALLYNVRYRIDRGLHVVDRGRRLVGRVLGYEPDDILDFGLDRASLARDSAGRYAILLHGTSRPEREWAVERWIALGAALELRGYDVVLPWTSERERARSERVVAVLQRARVCARLALDDLAGVIAGASLAVGVDSGLTQLAAALGVPLVAIFVASDPGLTGPTGTGPIAIVGGQGEMPAADEVIGAAAGVG
jgi:heptosyltransferase-1